MRGWDSLIGTDSIKESFDNLAAGLCYFDDKGLPVMINRTMEQLFFEMTGKDLQYETELTEAIAALDKEIFTSKDETIWRFQCRRAPKTFTEYFASDITEIIQKNQSLGKKNEQLQEINKAIDSIGKNYLSIIREEEILSMKMRIHSGMGECVFNIKKFYQDGCSGEKKQKLIDDIRSSVSLLKGEVGKSDESDPMEELLRTAESIGAAIHISGPVPEDEHVLGLLVLAMRECLMNALRHADGNTLYVEIQKEDLNYRVSITNNGRPPVTSVIEGGGLTSLRKKIRRAGGEMTISSEPYFCFNMSVSEKKDDW